MPLTHFNAAGEAHMVDVGDKAITHRTAVAEGCILMQSTTLGTDCRGRARQGGDAGRGAHRRHHGRQAYRRVDPALSPAGPDSGDGGFTALPERNAVRCQAIVETRGSTGVEMEALTAVQVALLTIYDMCKAVDRGMTLTDIRLLEKTGGRSGAWRRS